VADASLARTCSDHGILLARFCELGSTADAPGEAALILETGPVFTAEEEDSLPARLLDGLDAGRMVEVDRNREWADVYGPCLVDGALDLLLDGATGCFRFSNEDGWSEAQLGQTLALLADRQAELMRIGGDSLATVPGGHEAISYLPPSGSVLERFAHDRRAVLRRRSEAAGAAETVLVRAAD
jgi:hypothetical protein